MSNLAPTHRRYAVRAGIARYSLFVAGWAFIVVVFLVLGSVAGIETWHNPDYVRTTNRAIAFLAVLVPTFATIGAAFGLGRCRIACIAIIGVVAVLLSLVLAAAVTL
ncbi:hypothetical protein ACXYTP_19415 [Tsukamurella ocularis]|uniref:hypothetical protein n=1 Tax=Tsukamurella ocularis TaxID=1970234 RepID=UPI0039EF4D16